MNKGYEKFINELPDAIATYPSLCECVIEGNEKILKGWLPIVDKEGRHWEDYSVEIHCSKNYPHTFPILYETSGKIPKIADWHVYEDTQSCCVKVQPEEILRCKNGITLTLYIKEEVIPYLFNQTYRRIEGHYANEEYSHGVMGIYEFYDDILKTNHNPLHTLNLMNYIATHHPPSRTSMCFCGRKIKYRHCHKKVFEKIKFMGDKIIMIHIIQIAKLLQVI